MLACLCVRGPWGTDRPLTSLPDLVRLHAPSYVCMCVCVCACVSSWLCQVLPAPSASDRVAQVVSDCLHSCLGLSESWCLCLGVLKALCFPGRVGTGPGYGMNTR